MDFARTQSKVEWIVKNILATLILVIMCGMPLWFILFSGINWAAKHSDLIIFLAFYGLSAVQIILVAVFVWFTFNIWTDNR